VLGNPTEATYEYTNGAANYVISAQAFTDDGLISAATSNTQAVAVTVEAVQPGTTLVNGTLFIIGSETGAGNDTATINQSGGDISVNASMNGTNPFVASAAVVNSIVVRLGSGNDILVSAPNITVPMTIEGGEGNDLITAGGGADFIDGGPGIDILSGGGGNDVLIGGNGSDMLVGQAGEDLLIGGSTDHDIDEIMAKWTSSDSFIDRVADITAILHANTPASATVFDDDATDIIMGGGGRDLVFGNSSAGGGVVDLLVLSLLQDVLVEIN
jgi:Ca2+-binding RTX toxin-like protein